MPVFRDRVKDTTSSTGTGDVTLSGTAPTGYRTFSSAFQLGDIFLYCIEDTTTGAWETGAGYLSGTTTLVRDSVMDSSNSGNLVNFAAGSKNVFCTITSHFVEDVDSGAMLARARGYAMP